MSAAQGRVAVGHPVDVATGTMFNTWVDFVVGGIVPLAFTRFYSSALASRGARGPLGLGWRHGLQHELKQTVEGFAYVDRDGTEVAIEDLDGAFAARGRLIVPRDQVELRGTLDEVEVVPYGAGPPISYWFRRRRGTNRYALHALGRNQSLRLELEHDAQERLTRVVQRRSGRALVLEHDAADRIAAVHFESEGRRDPAVRFAYDAAGRLATATHQSGQVWRYEYDRAGLMLSEVSSLGPLHTFRYDASSRCVFASGADRFEERQLAYFPREHRTEVADSHGAITVYRYNDAGQVLETVNPLGEKEQYEYDADGRMVAITDALGRIGRLEYDRWGHLCAATYPDGKKAATRLDERHLPIAMSDYWGNVWRYEYDDRGQLLRSVNPSGHEWSYAYDAHGEVVAVRDPTGAVARLGWDRAGNPAEFVGADGGAWRKEFDRYGRCTAEWNPAGGVSRFDYDAVGDLVRVTAPDGRVSASRREAARRAETRQAPDGRQATVVFNACGKPVEEWRPDGSVVRYEWDTEPGRLLSVTDGLGRSVRYRYDAAGRVAERWGWDGGRTGFERDPLGNVTAVVDAAGGRTEYAYDDWGRVARRTAADGGVTEYAYDANGLAVRVQTADALVELERDCYGRVLAERQNGVTVTSRYDAAGRRVELRSDLGAEAAYDWTPGGSCAAVRFRGKTVRFEYDPLGREIAAELAGGWRFEQAYDPCGRLLRQACSRLGGPVDATAPAAQGTPIVTREYRYDADGSIEAISDSLRGAARFVHDRMGGLHAVVGPDEQIECFGYDRARNRTFAVRAAGGAVAPLLRELDRRGAIEPRELTPGEELERVERGAGNSVVRVTRGARTVHYQYDALGQLTGKRIDGPGSSERWSFEWNATGQLAAVVRPDGARWAYQYDGLGRRVAKIAPDGARRTYVWDGRRLLHDAAAAGTATVIAHPNVRAPLLREVGGAVEYALLDHLGAVCERIDEGGNLVWRGRRGTWGEAGEAEEGAPGFPGQQLDPESGLYYNHHRYYDPELGKYISADPIGLLGGLNDYAYVPSPIEWTDELGLRWGGGPYPWPASATSSGYPDLRNNRDVGRPYKGQPFRLVDPPGSNGPDNGGKTLALLRGANENPNGQLGDLAFVSGGTKKNSRARTQAVFGDVVGYTGGHGNYSHAEIQALTWYHENRGSFPDSGAHLYIDRPPCGTGKNCNAAVAHYIERYHDDFPVTVHYVKTNENGDLERHVMYWDADAQKVAHKKEC